MILVRHINYFHESSDKYKNILWGEVDNVDGELFWCRGGAKVPNEVPVNGNTEEPFFLVSLASGNPNLNAIPITNRDISPEDVCCLYSKDIFEQCKSGNRTSKVASLEDMLSQHN